VPVIVSDLMVVMASAVCDWFPDCHQTVGLSLLSRICTQARPKLVGIVQRQQQQRQVQILVEEKRSSSTTLTVVRGGRARAGMFAEVHPEAERHQQQQQAAKHDAQHQAQRLAAHLVAHSHPKTATARHHGRAHWLLCS